MPNKIFRDRVCNNIAYAIREAQNASRVEHPGLVGRIRELVADSLIKPMLLAGFETGTGKIVDNADHQSSEIDLVVYSKAILTPIMFSQRDGMYPIKSSYYAIEIKSQSNAANIQDAIAKSRSVISLEYPGKENRLRPNLSLTVCAYFAFEF